MNFSSQLSGIKYLSVPQHGQRGRDQMPHQCIQFVHLVQDPKIRWSDNELTHKKVPQIVTKKTNCLQLEPFHCHINLSHFCCIK